MNESTPIGASAGERFGDSRCATSVLGVAQLPAQLLVMPEATAADGQAVLSWR